MNRRAGSLAAMTGLMALFSTVMPAQDRSGTGPLPIPVANPLEARVGMMVQPSTKRQRLDIGHRVDLYTSSEAHGLRIGTEFFTLTRLQSEGNFKFPVETTDFWFGVTAAMRPFADQAVDVRLRLAHISSHLVDGAADASGVFAERRPYVYSREFADVLVGYTLSVGAGDVRLRPYLGGTWLWAVQPRIFDRVIPQAGVDVHWTMAPTWELRAGYDVKAVGIDGRMGVQAAGQVGAYWKTSTTTGLQLAVYRYDGRSIHGLYADQYDAYWAVGVQALW